MYVYVGWFFGKSLILDRKNPIFCTKITIFSKKSPRSGYGSEIFLVILNDSCHVPLSHAHEPRYSAQTYVLELDNFFENIHILDQFFLIICTKMGNFPTSFAKLETDTASVFKRPHHVFLHLLIQIRQTQNALFCRGHLLGKSTIFGVSLWLM